MKEIEVNLKTKGTPSKETIDPSDIDYINASLGECIIHFVDGTRLHVAEEADVIFKKIKHINEYL